MTEDEARDWISRVYGSARLATLERFAALLLEANRTQNLISKASEPHIWVRHLLDSAQLGRFARDAVDWLDVGSGPGLPGLVIAILEAKPVLMVEPRRKRVEFLRFATETLGLSHAEAWQGEVERLSAHRFGAVTARAFAALGTIFSSTYRLTEASTIWVLPKGRSAEQELAAARQAWQGVFHVEQSLTDDDARIVVAREVRPR